MSKKKNILILVVIGTLCVFGSVFAALPNYWVWNGTSLTPLFGPNTPIVVGSCTGCGGGGGSATTTYTFPLLSANNRISLPTSTNSTSGYLSAIDWGNFNNKLATSTGLSINNFTSANLSLWTNNLNWVQSSSLSSYLTTSTGLSSSNFTTSSVGQWANNGLYAVSSSLGTAAWRPLTDFLASSTVVNTPSTTIPTVYVVNNLGNWTGTWQGTNSSTYYLASNPSGYISTSTYNANFGTAANRPLTDFLASSTMISSYATGTVAATWSAIQTFNTTSTFNALVKFSSSTATKCARFDANQNLVSATGDCPAGDTTGAGAQGTVTTSTVVTANYFPFWTTTNGTSLTGTSTLFLSGFSLFTGGSFNASGTITQNGVNVLTTSTGLGATNFASANISQWTNNSSFVTDSSVSSTYTAQGASITTRNLIVASSGPLMSFAVSGNTLTATSISTATILTGYTPTTALSSYATSTVAITWTALDTHNSTTTNNSSTILAGSVSSTVASKLWSSGADGVLVGYAGNSCAVGSLVTSISAAGVVSCNTTSSILTGYVTSTAFLAQGTTINAQTLTMATSGAPLISITVAGTTATFTSAATSTILAGYTTTAGLPSYATSTVAGNWTTTQQFSLASTTQLISASTTLNGMTTMTGSIHTGTSTFKGLLNTTGTLDTLVTSGCGTGASIQGSAGRGWVKTGSTASSTCSVAYSTPFPATGSSTCIMTPQASSSAPFIVISSSTGFTIRTLSSTMMVSNTFGYWCFGVY